MFSFCRNLWEQPEHGLIQGKISDVCGNCIPGPFPGAGSRLRPHRWGPDHCRQWLSRSCLHGRDVSKEQFIQVLRELQTCTAQSEFSHLHGIAFEDRCHSHHISCPVLLLNLLIPSTPSPSSLTSERWQKDSGEHSSLPTRTRGSSQGGST